MSQVSIADSTASFHLGFHPVLLPTLAFASPYDLRCKRHMQHHIMASRGRASRAGSSGKSCQTYQSSKSHYAPRCLVRCTYRPPVLFFFFRSVTSTAVFTKLLSLHLLYEMRSQAWRLAGLYMPTLLGIHIHPCK
jgi:hypothetical protein